MQIEIENRSELLSLYLGRKSYSRLIKISTFGSVLNGTWKTSKELGNFQCTINHYPDQNIASLYGKECTPT